METTKNLLSSPSQFPTRTLLKNSLTSSVLMFNEQVAPSVTSIAATSMPGHFPSSVLSQEQRNELRPIINRFKEDGNFQEMLDRQYSDIGTMEPAEMICDNSKQLLWDVDGQCPNIWKLDMLMVVEPEVVVNIARKALSASKEAASLNEISETNNPASVGLGTASASEFCLENVKTVRSTRRLERQTKRRKVFKRKDILQEPHSHRRAVVQRNTSLEFDPNDPLRLFLWGPETKQLLTAEEESELVAQVQDLMELEDVKNGLQIQFGREPTLVEWAEAIGLSSSVLQLRLHSWNCSREKLINANLRMVVHIAKQYQGRGLSLQDLLQEGSMGLMKSVEKFKPQAGCRFASYAYWWIRQTIRKAIFQHSRTIRLPESINAVLARVQKAKKSFIKEGNHQPTKEDIARRVGITTEKLDTVLFMGRMPLSVQQTVWSDQDTTFQEITADTEIENTDISVSKQLMRQHVHGLLNTLNPREQKIIRLRFGIGEQKPKSLSEIGDMFRLSKERVRQLESRAMYKLKQCLGSHGLEAYSGLLH